MATSDLTFIQVNEENSSQSLQFAAFDHLLSVSCVYFQFPVIIYCQFPVYFPARDLVIFIGKIIPTTPPSFNRHFLNHRAVWLPSFHPQEPRQTSFTLNYRSPPIFQACLRSIGVQHICHKSLHLRFSKQPKSLLCFSTSLTVLLSIQGVERRYRIIEIKQSINRAHISTTSDKSMTGLPFPPVHMCVVEKAVRNQTTERKFTRWREEGRVVILSPVKEICSL